MQKFEEYFPEMLDAVTHNAKVEATLKDNDQLPSISKQINNKQIKIQDLSLQQTEVDT